MAGDICYYITCTTVDRNVIVLGITMVTHPFATVFALFKLHADVQQSSTTGTVSMIDRDLVITLAFEDPLFNFGIRVDEGFICHLFVKGIPNTY
jgi:hypothetical protein